MRNFIITLFLMFPLFVYSQILTPQEIIKKRDSLATLNNELNWINNKNKFQYDSLNNELIIETKKRIPSPNKLNFLKMQLAIKRNQILLTNKQIQNNIRLIRKYPLPTSATGKSKPN